MSTSAIPKTPFLPPFPVVDIVLEPQGIAASSQGTETYRVDIENPSEMNAEDLNHQGALLASQVLAELNLADDVRIELYDQQGNQHHMWYSQQHAALYPLKTAGLAPVGSKAVNRTRSSKGRLASVPGLKSLPYEQRVLVIIVLSLILVVGGSFGLRYLLKNLGSNDTDQTPPAAQLPVTAPAGWDTYADYAVEASMVNPIIANQEIIYAHDAELRHIDADTGVPTGKTSVEFKISEIHHAYGLAEDTISVAGSGSQAAIGVLGEDTLTTIEQPEEYTTLTWVSGVPVYQGSGFIWVPNEHGELKRYTAPADTTPAVIDGQSVWMVSKKEPKAWHIQSDSPELPEPAEIPAVEGHTYKGLVAGINKHIVVMWSTEDMQSTQLEILDATGEHRLENARTVLGKASEYNTVIDPTRNLLLSQGTFIDVSTNEAMKVSTSAKYGAGYAWASGIDSQRVSVDGEVISWKGTSNSVIPAEVDTSGRALVIYKPTNSSDVYGKLYVLSKAQ